MLLRPPSRTLKKTRKWGLDGPQKTQASAYCTGAHLPECEVLVGRASAWLLDRAGGRDRAARATATTARGAARVKPAPAADGHDRHDVHHRDVPMHQAGEWRHRGESYHGLTTPLPLRRPPPRRARACPFMGARGGAHKARTAGRTGRSLRRGRSRRARPLSSRASRRAGRAMAPRRVPTSIGTLPVEDQGAL